MRIIIHGPQGCGKSHGAEALAAYFDCSAIIDDWNGRTPIPANALVLTSLEEIPVKSLSDVRVMSFDEAIGQIVGIAIAQALSSASSTQQVLPATVLPRAWFKRVATELKQALSGEGERASPLDSIGFPGCAARPQFATRPFAFPRVSSRCLVSMSLLLRRIARALRG